MTMHSYGNWSASMHRRRRFKQNIPLFLMLIPVFVFYIVFKYVPIMGNIIAFKDYNFYDGILRSPWIGLQNFEILLQQPRTLEIIRNTLMLSFLQLFVGFPVPIILAIMLNEVRRLAFKKIVQTIVYLPHFFNWVIIGGIVITIFSLESGMVNNIIKQWTGEPYPFLYEKITWISIFVGSGIWKEMGFQSIIYLAALSTIDPSLYEAANMDGANKLKQIWHVTIPGIRTTIVILFILSTGQIMEVGFDQVYMLQNPVVSEISEVISTYIYRVGLQGAQFSLTAAMGLFEALTGLILILTANAIARKFNEGLF